MAPLNHKNPVIIKTFYAVFAFSAVILLGNVLSRAFRKSVSETISVNIIKFIVIAVGTLLILNQIGIKLTPILTALGIGSLAVALALQDTLGNFFAGMNILLGRHIVRGDYIKLDCGQEGTVVEIGWRATKIKELSNVVIVIPNIKIASAIISKINYRRTEINASINCGVAYGSDLEKVEKIAVEAAAEIINSTDGAVKNYTPVCQFIRFDDSSINFTLTFKVKDVFVRGALIHAVLKNLKKKFDEENIEIPFPQRVVQIQKGGEKDF
jgi:small-conductance mechanosensitive channel